MAQEMQIVRIKLWRILPAPELRIGENNQFVNVQPCGLEGNFCERFKKPSGARLEVAFWMCGHQYQNSPMEPGVKPCLFIILI